MQDQSRGSHPQHYGSMMPTVRDSSGRALYPGDDGWKTPTIEDANHPLNIQLSNGGNSGIELARRLSSLHQRRRRNTQNDRVPTDSSDESMSRKMLPWRDRIKHVTWAWFTMTMATGGIANVISAVPYRFHGLETIGTIFFLLNIVLYILIWAMMLTRFWFYPYQFKTSFTHPTESLFAPAFAVSFGTILINIVEYGFDKVGYWLNKAVLILFWFDTGLALLLSIAIYFILWSTQTFTISRMTPIWIFPAYPLLIIGPHASNLSKRLTHAQQAIQVVVGGFTVQGIGFLVALTIYSAFVYRLMSQKLPDEPLRPGMFVSVGPSAFTVSGTIGMAANLKKILEGLPSKTYMGVQGDLAANILKLVANWSMLWLWGLAWWFFFISLLSNLDCLRHKHHIPFAMTWFSFVFPQTALTTATFQIGDAFDVAAIKIIGCVMTCLLIVVWFAVVGMMVRAIFKKQILWPEKGEDKTEGGFSQPTDRKASTSTKQEKVDPAATA